MNGWGIYFRKPMLWKALLGGDTASLGVQSMFSSEHAQRGKLAERNALSKMAGRWTRLLGTPQMLNAKSPGTLGMWHQGGWNHDDLK